MSEDNPKVVHNGNLTLKLDFAVANGMVTINAAARRQRTFARLIPSLAPKGKKIDRNAEQAWRRSRYRRDP